MKNNTELKTYRISAYDMLFFGDGRPFTMAEESWVQGIFPPNLSTIYGYLRGIYFENNMDKFKSANIESEDPTLNLKIHQFALELETQNSECSFQTLYPIPACFVKDKDTKNIEQLQLINTKLISSSMFDYRLFSNKDGKKEPLIGNHYITQNQLSEFLYGETITNTIDITNILSIENRLGIAKNYKTGKTEDGRLYRMQLNNTENYTKDLERLKKIHFKLSVSGLELPEKHFTKIGGEGKIGMLNKIDNSQPIKLPATINNKALIYIASPTILEEGTEILNKLLDTYNIAINFIANDDPLYIGGWDIEKKCPKPTKKALPTGSLIYIEFKNDAMKTAFIAKYQNKTLDDCKDNEYTKQGYNQLFIGNY